MGSGGGGCGTDSTCGGCSLWVKVCRPEAKLGMVGGGIGVVEMGLN
jgi:hypothetical protein